MVDDNLPTNRWKTTWSLTGLHVVKQQLSMSPDEFILAVLFKFENTICSENWSYSCDLLAKASVSSNEALNFLHKPTSTSHGWEGWISVEWGICLPGRVSPANSSMLHNFCNDKKKANWAWINMMRNNLKSLLINFWTKLLS